MVTVSDIAKIAGVSATTVSRAFNPESVIKPETRAQIIKIANDLNYIPNFNARSLVTRKSYIIGVFFTSMYQGTSSIYLGDIISQLYQELPKNYLLSVNSIDRLTEMGNGIERRFDGILIVSQSSVDNELIYRIKMADIPLVVINRYIEDPEIVNVMSDEAPSINEAVKLAVADQHRNFGIINGIESFNSSVQRRDAFLKALAQFSTDIQHTIEVTGDYTIQSGYASMRQILEMPKSTRPSFVFCANDDMAIGAINACNEAQITVPDEMAIMGYDDVPYASVITPGLTTVHNPYKEMSTQGIQLLLQLINGKTVQPKKYSSQAQLVIRKSTAK
ncbi:LacI family DNA-binding transcriptional regulator [Latilactobacillus fuchuensis]|uniref:Transcriptional regulator (LacI family) n=1 Tax=Latilactobacillus fuchuensis TaxID=164393 RepID=A0A2N9DUX4_9LACO|nr:LacI family DNA-binding transcriptional regulator [Latilactobacillus fuchuensis]SPC37983.1 transcriptional regulator (LacI family) [Latilactobacillus fuchuensis]